MQTYTQALIDYWHRLPATPSADRHRSLEHACQRVRSGELPAIALVPYALGDFDEDIVHGAVVQYLGSPVTGTHTPHAALEEALEWVRRGLALNRGAVFAALLGQGDPAINERLAPLRLGLSAEEFATVARRAGRRACAHARQFLADWLELIVVEGPGRQRESRQGSSAGLRIVPSHEDTSRGLRSPSHVNTSSCQETRCTYARVSL